MDTHTDSGLPEDATINPATSAYPPQANDPFVGDAPLTPDTLATAMASARTAFTSSEDRAADAAAQAFCIWYWCSSPVAPSDMQQAYDTGVKKRNDQIKKFNESIKNDQKDEKDAFERFEKETKIKIETANDPDVIAQLEADIKAREKQYDEKIKELRAARLVLIKERDGTVPFVEAVKYALDLTKQTQASQVNRYASALGWIHKKVFDGGKLITTKKPNAVDIVAKIKKVGGVKGAADIYKNEQVDGEAAINRTTIAEAINTKLKNALRGVTPMATAQMPIDTGEEEYVLLFAHKKGGNVELLSKLNMSTEEATNMAASHTTANMLKGTPATEFLGETLAVANQIDKPVIYCDAARHPEQLLVTFKEMQDGAPILHATPKPVAVSLMPTNGSMLLEDNEVEQLAKRLGNAFQRKLVSVGIASTPGMTTGKAPTPSPFAWETTNTALAAENRVAAVAAHTWTNADYVGERPHDVIDIQPNIVVSITAATLRTLANGQLKAWTEDKSAKKANNVMTLTFSADDLTVAGEKNADNVPVTLIGTPPKHPSCQVTLHPKALGDAFQMMLDTSAQTFVLMPDNHGVVKVHWETDFGIYDLHLPLCRKGRKFETRLIAPIR